MDASGKGVLAWIRNFTMPIGLGIYLFIFNTGKRLKIWNPLPFKVKRKLSLFVHG